MVFSVLSLFFVAASSLVVAKYSDVNFTRLFIRMGGYSSIYYDKLKKTISKFRANPACVIERVEVNNQVVADHSCIFAVMEYDTVKINYRYKGKQYIQMHFNSAPIHFPLETVQVDADSPPQGFVESCDDIILVSVTDSLGDAISITVDDVDVLKQYSGPKGTFYRDHDPNYCTSIKEYMLRDMHIDDPDCTLQLLYSNGNCLDI